MVRSVTQEIVKEGNTRLRLMRTDCFGGSGYEVQDLATIAGQIGEIPRETSYHVTYTLDDEGEFLVRMGQNFIILRKVDNPAKMVGAVVCFLPNEWVAKRVNRTVTPV